MSGSGGNLIWWFPLGLSVVALTIVFERLLAIRRAWVVLDETAPRANPIKRFATWPALLGLAVLLFVAVVAQWQIWARVLPPREGMPVAPAGARDHRLHIAVSANGSITAESDGDPVALDEMTSRLGRPGADVRIELDIDPQARGDAVDRLLVRLCDAGVSRCTLLCEAALAAEPPQSVERARFAPGQLRADVEPDPDMETPVVLVSTRGDSVHFQVGSRDAGSGLELQKLLEPLARLGAPISVRINHDGLFMHTSAAITACRDAGFTTVLLVPGKPAR